MNPPTLARRPPAARVARKRVAPAAASDVASAPSTLDKIVDAAAHLFATRGYIYSTLDDVAAHAGFTKGAVYYYFKDKESLLVQVLEHIEARSIDTTARAVAELDGAAAKQLETFVKFQTRWAARYPEDLAVLMLMSAETAHTSPKVRAQVQGVYAKLAATLETIIETGKRSGEFNKRQDTRDTVLYLQAVHDGNMMIWYRSGTEPEIGRRLARVTLSGFLKAVAG